MLVTPTAPDRSEAAIAAAWRGWQYEMARSHDRMPSWWWDLGARRRVFDSALVIRAFRPAAEIERDIAVAKDGIAFLKRLIKDEWVLRRARQRHNGINGSGAQASNAFIRKFIQRIRVCQPLLAELRRELEHAELAKARPPMAAD